MKMPVPNTPGPAGKCWQQNLDPKKGNMMARCGYPEGHEGPHQWEVK